MKRAAGMPIRGVSESWLRSRAGVAKILECTPEEYRRDPCPVPSLNQSTAVVLVTQSPAHARLQHPGLAKRAEAPTKATDRGSIVHDLLLAQASRVILVEAESFRSADARAQRDAARAAGCIPILKQEHEGIMRTVSVLRDRLAAYGIDLTKGRCELPFQWYEKGANGPIVCRSMMDSVFISDCTIYEVKTSRDARLKHCGVSAVEFGYDIQAHAYRRCLEQYLEAPGRVDVVFLSLELEAPFALTPWRPDGRMRELGQARWHRACMMWERCLATNRWPAYTTAIENIGPPAWAWRAEFEGETY
jgi:PDDEXK-like uncharacterized protein DUF3799